MDINRCKLKIKDIYKACSPSVFKFESTADIKPLQGIIGQDRAVRSLGFALDIENEGYNIYLAGYYGTGKTTLAHEMLEEKARKNKVPPDWCYVNNFKNPENPHVLSMPAGLGKEFKSDVDANMDTVIKHIVKAFEGEDFEYQKSTILNRFMEDTNQIYMHLEEEARTYNFTVSRSQNGVTSIPLKEDGTQLNQDEYMALPENERTELMKKSSIIQEKINEAFRQYKELEKKIKEEIKELEMTTAKQVAEPDFDALYKKYKSLDQVVVYLQDMYQDVLDNLEMFKSVEDESPVNILRRMDKRAMVRRYQVNQIVDNSTLKHAPVIFETNPSFSNLFGQVEFGSEFGVLTTDFSRIKAGSVHRANGGYLVIHVYDIIKNFYVWDKLKRIIKNREIIVESLSKNLGWGNSETLQPEAIPVNLKVVLIGEPEYYYMLHAYDEEFQKLFKIKADFDTEMERNPKHVREYARLVSSVCAKNNLRHFTPQAVAELVDYGSRTADDQSKLSTLFSKLVEIIYESNCWAGYAKASLVDRDHVKQAITEKLYRSSMLQEKMQEYIDQGIIMIDVDGSKIGQLNGLAVYQIADHQFGKPVRITAKTFMGEKGLVNIEREIQLSGSIHSKGVLTLNGYLGAQYAQHRPLSLSASLTLEQSYGGIEGDSASSAELYALLSSLAEVPLQQGIAVTGSVNQNGEIQAVGGVNAKIEGFFQVCKNRGLTGRQGVVIPRQNVTNLMLNEEVAAAVKANQFSIWAITHVNEGLEILTGIEAGEANAAGDFTPNSIHCLVCRKLGSWSNRSLYGMMGDMRPIPRKTELRRRTRR